MPAKTDIWPIEEIEDWDELEDAVSRKLYRDWLFRGHSEVDWKLESSLFRLFGRGSGHANYLIPQGIGPKNTTFCPLYCTF